MTVWPDSEDEDGYFDPFDTWWMDEDIDEIDDNWGEAAAYP